MSGKSVKTIETPNISKFSGEKWQLELESKLNIKVRWDTVTLQLYSTAACFYDITPLAVVIPESIEDIQTVVNICSKHQIPVLPRGAGSSLSGNAVSEAVILDLSHNFNDIIELDDHHVQSGVSVVLNDLQSKLKLKNKKFAPDPSSGNVCVIGGMLGNNSGGPHTIKHGNMYKHVVETNLVLSNGKIFSAKNIPLNEISMLGEFHRPYYLKAKELLEKYSNEINEFRPHTTKNASGYQVWDVLTETHLNLASMMVGSEGTLGVFTDAKLKIIPIIPNRGIISFYFTDIAKMGVAVKHLRTLGASAIEFVDHSFIKLALTFRPELKKFLPDNVKYLLYVEFESEDENHIEELFQKSKEIIADKEKLAEVGSYSTDEIEIVDIFKVRKAATVILNKVQGIEKSVPFVEDAAIHPDVFSEFLIDLSDLLKNYSFTYALFGHAGDGNLHLRPLLNFKDAESFKISDEFMTKFVELVTKYNGSLSGEHGDGRLRTPFLPQRYPKLIRLFEELKNLFDPIGIMNPDIIVPIKKYKWNENLRLSPNYKYVETSSRLDSDQWRTEIEKCHGCGTCREYCPVYVATGIEEATARAKANILRGIISGKVSTNEIDSDHFYEIMNHCLNCGQCLTDCPTGVNIPGMAVLAKEKLHEKRSFTISEYVLQRGKIVSTLAFTFSSISNMVLKLSFVRTMMQFTVGIHKLRNMPLFAKRKYELTISGEKKKVVLWTGCAAQFNDPEGEFESSKEILTKLGFDVILPEWKCCNVAMLSYGNLEGTKNDIDFNVETLMPYVNKEIPIIFSSASCGYAFMHEYTTFFPERKDFKKIANMAHDIHDFLGLIFSDAKYIDNFKPVNNSVVYHEPCHLKTQANKYGPKDLLKYIPHLELININDSCCGIAGTFGMKKDNFDLSMEIGSKLFSEILNASPEYALSGCGTCQIQINQGTGLKVIHPITLLNQSFQPKEK
jgi:FAD/FMN-containing dehydrogenase/Fe-S oxidoreductase